MNFHDDPAGPEAVEAMARGDMTDARPAPDPRPGEAAPRLKARAAGLGEGGVDAGEIALRGPIPAAA